MSEMTKATCSYAIDGICRLPDKACASCKLTKEDSAFHATHIMGMTMDELERMQGGKMKRGGRWK